MDYSQCLTIFMIVATNLGTILTLYFQLDKKIESNRAETNAIVEGIRQDLRDFHGRLCAIEERNRK